MSIPESQLEAFTVSGTSPPMTSPRRTRIQRETPEEMDIRLQALAEVNAHLGLCAMGCGRAARYQYRDGDGEWTVRCVYCYKVKAAEDRAAKLIDDALPKELYCSTCDTVVDAADLDDQPWYCCWDCDEEFNRDGSMDGGSHRCPSCNKFASRSESPHCGDCTEELEERTVQVSA